MATHYLDTLAQMARQSGGRCTCGNLRMAARAVTQMYDGLLQPTGLKATQLNVLVAAAALGEATVSQLAAALVMDRTTLTRNLKPLVTRKLLQVAPGADRRNRVVTLTATGRDTLRTAWPHWSQAQDRVVAGLGRKRWQRLLADLSAVVSLLRA